MLRAAGGAPGLVALNIDDSTQNVDEQPCCSDEFFCPLACSPDHPVWASRCLGELLGGFQVPARPNSAARVLLPLLAHSDSCSSAVVCSLQVSRDETVGRESFITEGPWLTGVSSGTQGMPHGPRQPSVGVQDKELLPEAAVRLCRVQMQPRRAGPSLAPSLAQTSSRRGRPRQDQESISASPTKSPQCMIPEARKNTVTRPRVLHCAKKPPPEFRHPGTLPIRPPCDYHRSTPEVPVAVHQD